MRWIRRSIVFYLRNALVLGAGADLYFITNFGGTVERQLHLEGVEPITGIASDYFDSLLMLDGPSRRVLELSLEQIRAVFNTAQR